MACAAKPSQQPILRVNDERRMPNVARGGAGYRSSTSEQLDQLTLPTVLRFSLAFEMRVAFRPLRVA
jgi:hypothetical protein